MEKVKLSKEQAAFVEEWKSIKTGFENIVRALTEDYEIEPDKSKFKAGDKVISQISGDKILTLSNPMVGKPAWFFMNETVSWGYEENFRHATPDEIFWLETLGRDFIGDFREGDIILTKTLKPYVIVGSNKAGLCRLTIDSAQKLLFEYGNVSSIHPEKSIRSLPKEDSQ